VSSGDGSTPWQREKAVLREAIERIAREKAANPTPSPGHDCPPYCHRCPDMKGEVLPFCTAVAMALDWEDLSVCTCHDNCTCGNPSHEQLCECEHIPLLFRQIGIVGYADLAQERARSADYESKRRQAIIRRARAVADSLVPLTRSLPPSVRERVNELVRLLHQTSDDVPDQPQPPRPTRGGSVVRGAFK
jgi:hypothetical protein